MARGLPDDGLRGRRARPGPWSSGSTRSRPPGPLTTAPSTKPRWPRSTAAPYATSGSSPGSTDLWHHQRHAHPATRVARPARPGHSPRRPADRHRSSATAADPVSLTLRPGANQLYVLDATPGQSLELVDGGDAVVGTGIVDAAGSLAWRELDAGVYTVRTTGDPGPASDPVDRARTSPTPRRSSRSTPARRCADGFGYIDDPRRHHPLGATSPARTGRPARSRPWSSTPATTRATRRRDVRPSSTTRSGYAYVGVNMRGTGCSGGSFLTSSSRSRASTATT